MKKVSFRVRNFDKEQFLTYNIDNEAELDEDVLDFLEEEEPSGIVPVIFEDDGEECDTFSYNVTDKIHLSELSNQEINAEMVLKVLRGIVLALIDMAEYRIPLSYLVMNRNYIYIDSDYKVEFICIPLEEMQEKVDVNSFLRQLIASLRFDPMESGDYVAKLLSYVNNIEKFNLHNMRTLIEELMNRYGIEIPEDDGADIYVDYQEVVEDHKEAVEEHKEAVEEHKEADHIEEADSIEEIDGIAEADSIKETDGIAEAEAIISNDKDNVAEEENIKEDDEDLSDEESEIVGETAFLKSGDIQNSEEVEEDIPSDGEIKNDVEAVDEKAAVSDAEEMEKEIEEEAKEIVDQLKKKVVSNNSKKKGDKAESFDKEPEEKNDNKKSTFKTKDTSTTGVVIQDDFEEFLAEKEKEEEEQQGNRLEESSLKIKKNVKVSRASIVKNTQEERKAELENSEMMDSEYSDEEEEEVSNSILSQTIGSTGLLKSNNSVPKVNPYLIRVNTNERIMIVKQNFKIGKASMGVDYTVQGNSAVSRIHAIITSKEGVYFVKDNKSTNHTFVNGKILNEGDNELLTHDSKIVLGDEEFIFKLR